MKNYRELAVVMLEWLEVLGQSRDGMMIGISADKLANLRIELARLDAQQEPAAPDEDDEDDEDDTPVTCPECGRIHGFFGDSECCINKDCKTGAQQRETIRKYMLGD